MTTAIAVYNSEGCVGRCDAKCHDAQNADCDCVCGGRLHGCGADNAIALNTEQMEVAFGAAYAWALDHDAGAVAVKMTAPRYEPGTLF